jgi:glycyl-radical enzyme activating protein
VSEKGIIFDIQRASFNDGPGIRTTVFLKGCPLSCAWCHNPESEADSRQLFFYFDKCTFCGACAALCPGNVHSLVNGTHIIDYDKCTFCGKCVEECNYKALKIVGKYMSVDEVMIEIMADFDFYTNSGGGITLSGGEPLIQFTFAMELLKICRKMNVNTCVETSGYISSTLFRQVIPYVDILLYDYKITGSEEHKNYTGVSNEMILENLDLAYRTGIPIILRCPIIPGINDNERHFKGIRDLDKKYPFLKGIELLPYHALGNSKRTSIGIEKTLPDLKTVTTKTTDEWLKQMKNLGCEKARIG